ncbi:MAG: hypothetical protein OI74_08935 [Gammaproteobacteria bacterium (ex Lamellibrachia satsuma)]|nr:MAG: hypothetical protein HPY30_10365 [Gammaproteobacteria bacterium (ex Lamellibrachia satsuma)]RRS33198.1 MAG: hypothetical protein OI74_08935 [Gammaproteobacteria bacterium (ex Lamellibrachia satsuma)]RRS36343.1 MAG: hypothetical protein NV67_07725 [Gammaproteobacteria bacterium (ex Lamellibrachia satsuma)]
MRAGISPLLFVVALFGLPCSGSAAIWSDVPAGDTAARGMTAEPLYYRSLQADDGALRQALAAAPLEFTSSQGSELSLPMPNGTMQRFRLELSPILAPELAARYPEITTYQVHGVDDPGASGRLDMTPQGFHGMITSTAGTVFIDPDGSGGYRAYYKGDYVLAQRGMGAESGFACAVDGDQQTALRSDGDTAQRTSGQRRNYRLALAATGEYTQFHGGTKISALSAMVTAINRVNQIYGRDIAVQFILVAGNDRIIYTDGASDPYPDPNNDLSDFLTPNRTNLDNVIGSANYDIGHVFSTWIGGGVAFLDSVCDSDLKGGGVTGGSAPIGDAFYIDFVSHEIGHQFGADHTFDGTAGACAGNRIPVTAVEPGSGSTIMSYAGICNPENLQLNSDATFHGVSIGQMVAFSTLGGGSSCGTLASSGNTAPTANAGAAFTIPKSTPFALTGSALDPELDTLSYQWDQMDPGSPLFRSYLPKDTPVRNFPRLSYQLTWAPGEIGEILPTVSRTMRFRLTARDGNSGVDEADLVVTVDGGTGPFDVNGGVLNIAGNYPGGFAQTINWAVGGTGGSCPQVEISLLSFSADGSTYCDHNDDAVLNLGTFPNTGSASPILPNSLVARGRVRVACSNNIFFSLSDADIGVTGTTAAGTACKATDGTALEHGTIFVDAGGNVTIPDGGGGGAALWLPLLLGLGGIGYTLRRRCNA